VARVHVRFFAEGNRLSRREADSDDKRNLPMAQATLTRILEEIQTLASEELRQVQNAIEQRLSPTHESPEEERFLQTLVESGLIKEIKRPPRDRTIQRPLVPIQGKPLSETIVEERR
jgi:hypothetical protein